MPIVEFPILKSTLLAINAFCLKAKLQSSKQFSPQKTYNHVTSYPTIAPPSPIVQQHRT
jgi:hypothetical protein